MFSLLLRSANAIMSIFQFFFLGKSMKALKMRYDMIEVASKSIGKDLVANGVRTGDTLANTAGKTIIDVLEQSTNEEKIKIVEAIDNDRTYLKDIRMSMSSDFKDLTLTYKGFGIKVDLRTRKISPTISF